MSEFMFGGSDEEPAPAVATFTSVSNQDDARCRWRDFYIIDPSAPIKKRNPTRHRCSTLPRALKMTRMCSLQRGQKHRNALGTPSPRCVCSTRSLRRHIHR